MARLFLGNFDFEHRLTHAGRQSPAKLCRLNAELATSWLAIADDGDYLWTPEPVDPAFFDEATAAGLPRVLPVTSFRAVPPGTECIPWGWTNEVRQLCDSHRWLRNDPPDAAVRAANSRRFSSSLEREWRTGLEFAGEAGDVPQIERFIDWHGPDSRWVIKAEFGMSGRERLIGSGPLTAADRNWIAKRLHAHGAVFFEPWLDKLAEAGIQMDVPRRGEPQCLDVVPMLADQRGQYGGSLLPSEKLKQAQFLKGPSQWNTAIDLALQAARRMQDQGYFGPLGIDAMMYRDSHQQVHVRPLQDINARWTMGRLGLGFRRLLKKSDFAVWLHGAPDSLSAAEWNETLRITNDLLDLNSPSRLRKPDRISMLRSVLHAQAAALNRISDPAPGQTSQLEHRAKLFQTLAKHAETLLAFQWNRIDDSRFAEQLLVVSRPIRSSPRMIGGKPCAHQSLLWIS